MPKKKPGDFAKDTKKKIAEINANPADAPVLGRPRVIDRAELKKELDAYIDKMAVPILTEFAYLSGSCKAYLYEMPDLADSIKRLNDKKEAMLEKLTLQKKLNPAMAIFSLKQMGWRDRIDININVTIQKLSAIFVKYCPEDKLEAFAQEVAEEGIFEE